MKYEVLRLLPSMDLRKSLQTFVDENGYEAGWIVTCVGSLSVCNLRLANANAASRFEGFFEILALSGTLSIAGSHLHISLADSNGKCVGGHLLEGCEIYTTAEIVMAFSNEISFTRERDEITGYNELVVQKTLAIDH